MKVLAVIGSPHFDGPGARLTMQAVRGAKDAGHEVTVYRVNEMDIRGCQGCNACKNASIDCVLKDDLAPYWKALHEADALIVSAPNYAANVCGPMITYMNRHYCLLDRDWRPRIHPGIRLIGIFTQGDADREKYKDVYRRYLADFENRDMKLVDMLVHTRADGVVTDECALARQAYELGRAL